MSNLVIFIVGAIVFSLTVYGAVMGAGIALTRNFYRENENFTRKPGYERAGPGQPSEQ